MGAEVEIEKKKKKKTYQHFAVAQPGCNANDLGYKITIDTIDTLVHAADQFNR